MRTRHYDLEAVCPNTGSVKAVRLMDDDLQRVLRYSPRYKFFELSGDPKTHTGSCVQETLTNPLAIFAGVRELQEGGQCYVARPSTRWFNSGSSGPPPPGMVYVVFLNPRDEVFEWRWEKADSENPDWPADWKKRFTGGKIWPQA